MTVANSNVAPSRVVEVRQAVASLGALLNDVRTNVDAGIEIDLSGLAQTTAALCVEVEALPPEDARSMVAELSDLVEKCEGIAARVAMQLGDEAVAAI